MFLKCEDFSIIRKVAQYRNLCILNQVARMNYSSELLLCLRYLSYGGIVLELAKCLEDSNNLPGNVLMITWPGMIMSLFIHKYLCSIGGEILQLSQKCKHVFVKMSAGRLNRKTVESLGDIRIHFGSSFFFHRSTFAVFIDAVIQNAIAITLSYWCWRS